jgi:RND family efflux transporter MFP subunit
VKVFEVGKTSSGQLRRISGRVVAAETSRLSFGLAGTVARLSVNPGDQFAAGQVLARLDEEPFRIAAERARAQLASARAKLDEADQAYGRVKELVARGVAAQADVDTALAAYEGARGNLRAEEANLETKERDLTMVNLVAPFAGQVIERGAEAFEEVTAGQAVVTVQSEGAFEAVVGIPETLIQHIDYGQPVTVTLSSGDGEMPAVVTEIGARSETGAAYPVSVRLTSEVAGLRAGMTATVQFSFGGSSETPVYLIPLSALALGAGMPEDRADDEAPLYVIADGRLEKRTVRIGDVRGNELEVYEGLEAGALIVSAGVPFLHEGMAVEVWNGALVDE